MSKGRYWVGLDVGEVTTSICVVGDDDEALLECVAETTADHIASALASLPLESIAAVTLEASSGHHLARQLRQRGYPVRPVDAGKVSKFLSIRQNKTDTNDARGLAQVGRVGRTASLAVHVKGVECQQLRSQLVMRAQMVQQKTAAHSALRALLRTNGSQLRRMSTGPKLRPQVESELVRLGQEGTGNIAAQVMPLLGVCEALTAYVAWTDRHLAQLAAANPVTRRFMQIPGVGPICAVSFYSAIEDPRRFSQSADVGAYLGLVPRVKQSGTLLQRSRITKAGNKLTRTHLVMAAGVMIGHAAKGCAIRDWGLALAERAGRSKARVAVARKLAVAMLSLWKAGRDFDVYPGPS